MDYKKIFNKISVGNKAREESGFAPAFINSSLEISDKFGTGLSFRDGNPPIPFGQFKPMSLKTKTASMGVVPMMTARKIVIDRDLHRAGSKDVPDKYKDIKSPKLNLRPSQNKGSLRLLFSDPHIEITEINDKGELFYRMRDVIEKDCHNPDAAKNTVYKINLKKPMDPPPLTSKQKDALRNTFRGNLELAAPPREWLDKLIEFNALDLDKEYHTFYQKERGQDFQKEMVVGNPPFSGDADMFSVSIPIHLAKTPLNKSQFIESPEDIEKFFNKINKIREIIKPRMQQKELAKKTNKILNRHKRKNQEAFIYDESQFGRLSFFVEMHMPSETVLKIIDDLEVFLRTDNLSGLATQYEFIVGAAINRVAGNTA
ncbi:MAG: hypothetical protein HRT87_08815, partial [Legionellales bacterium]|nr:hypothetical protein [Legionellales bacterium]